MRLTKVNFRKPKKVQMNAKAKAATIGAIAVAGLAVIIGTSTSAGADFSASDTGRLNAETASLTLSLSDGDNQGTFELNYDNVAPGDSVVQTFTVKNTGSIPADVSLGAPFSNLVVPSLPAADLADLRLGVDGYDAPTAITDGSVLDGFDLGTLNPGQERTYKVRLELDSSAGNSWQDRQVGATATVTLDQR